MNFRALFKYTLDINIFNSAFSLLCALFLGVFWAIVMFVTFGNVLGYIGFNSFKKHEYYTYYNLGFSKTHLVVGAFVCNIFIGTFLLGLYLIFNR